MPSCRFGDGNKKFAHIHIPKCAGTAISKAITVRQQMRFVRENGKYQPEKHADIHSLRERFGELGFTFTCVRNPWDRMVSAFHYYLRKEKVRKQNGKQTTLPETFEEWVLDHDWGTMNKLQGDYFDEVDFLIRYERLEEDFETLRTKHGVPLGELKMSNHSKHEHYRTYYDDETIEKVRNHFKDDIERFDYEY